MADESRVEPAAACPVPARVRTPWWVWALAAVVAGADPLLHAWYEYIPKDGAVFTGMHGSDGAMYLQCMRMFETGFLSPYAAPHAPLGDHAIAYFAVPFFWLYGAVGAAARAIGLGDFIALGLGNALAGVLYLVVVFRFLRSFVPRHAPLAFLLFVLGGGVMGLAFIVAKATGLDATPFFIEHFPRLAKYELVEGPHITPALHVFRLYYTIPLALGLGGLVAWHTTMITKCRRHLTFSLSLLLLATFLNSRLGPMLWLIGALRLVTLPELTVADRVRKAILLAAPAVLGVAGSWLVMRQHPGFTQNALSAVRGSLWLTPFVLGVLLHALLAPRQLVRDVRSLSPALRVFACACIGYLAVYALLLVGYEAYHGVLFTGRDYAAAVAVSDWSLIGAVPGAIAGLLFMGGRAPLGGRTDLGGRASSRAVLPSAKSRPSPCPLPTRGAWRSAEGEGGVGPAPSPVIPPPPPPPQAGGPDATPLAGRVGAAPQRGGLDEAPEDAERRPLKAGATQDGERALGPPSKGVARAPRAGGCSSEAPWVTLWFLVFFTIAVSAWGQGWFIRFLPQRFMVLLGLPLAILSAQAFASLCTTRPGTARTVFAAFTVSGAATFAVSTLCWQGPLFHTPGQGPLSYLHAEYMTPADARLLESLPPGRVLTPAVPGPYFGDVIALRPGMRVVQGMGTLNLSAEPSLEVDEAVFRFYTPGTPDDERGVLVRKWQVDYVFWPDTHPLPKETLAELRATSWLVEQNFEGRGIVFGVK